MTSSSSASSTPSTASSVTSQPVTRSPLLTFALIVGFFAIIALLPRVINHAVTPQGNAQAGRPAPLPASDEAQMAALDQACGLLSKGSAATRSDLLQAARLIENAAGKPISIGGGDNTNNGGEVTPFSSSLLVMSLARQIGSRAASCPATQREEALAWVQRCRLLADAVLSTPQPTFDALKTARYLDNIADKQELDLRRAWGDKAGETAALRQKNALTRVWDEQVLPLILQEPSSLSGAAAAALPLAARAEAEAHWSTSVALMVSLYQKERVVLSAA